MLDIYGGTTGNYVYQTLSLEYIRNGMLHLQRTSTKEFKDIDWPKKMNKWKLVLHVIL